MGDGDFTSGGGMTSQHQAVPASSRSASDPTDGTERFNVFRIPLVPAACWRLNDPAFAFDSSFVSPDFAPELAKLAALVEDNPGCPAALFAHADPVGSDEVNKAISDRRAIAVYAALTRQIDAWEDLYSNPVDGDEWGTKSVQAILGALQDPTGNAYYDDSVDGAYGPDTVDAVKRFQADAGLPQDGSAGPATRSKLFGAYMDKLCTDPSGNRFQMKPQDFLGGGADPGAKMALQGCSRFNPVVLLPNDEEGEASGPRDADNAPNRRVVMFLFKPRPTTLDEWPCPRVKEASDACKKQFWPDGEERRQNGDALRLYKDTHDTMACRFYDRFARRSPCEGGVLPTTRIRLFDKFGSPMENVPYKAQVNDQTIEGSAIASFAVLRVVLPATIHLQWSPVQRSDSAGASASDADGGSDASQSFEYAMDVFVDVSGGDRQQVAGRKLHNLGYSLGASLAENVSAFQRDYGLKPTGRLEDAQASLDQKHDEAVGRGGAGS